MTKRKARAWAKAQGDQRCDPDELRAAFRAVFGRRPDREDGDDMMLFSHICAAIYR